MNFGLNVIDRKPRLFNKMGHFGSPAVADVCPQKPGNREKHIAICRAPGTNHNRGRVYPTLTIVSAHPPETVNCALNLEIHSRD